MSITTLEEAKQYVLDKRSEGISCPCCGQLAKVYERKLNANMVVFLLALVRRFRDSEDWVHYSQCAFKGRDYPYLALFGLAYTCDDNSGVARTSGLWKPTANGIAFAHGNILVSSSAMVYNNEAIAFSDKLVGVRAVLGKRFNYSELVK